MQVSYIVELTAIVHLGDLQGLIFASVTQLCMFWNGDKYCVVLEGKWLEFPKLVI